MTVATANPFFPGRRGLPEGTRISEDVLARADRQRLVTALDLEMASFSLPHPFKRKDGVAMNRRLYGADELSEDLEVCEDAHFSLRVQDQAYMCVADGVGVRHHTYIHTYMYILTLHIHIPDRSRVGDSMAWTRDNTRTSKPHANLT